MLHLSDGGFSTTAMQATFAPDASLRAMLRFEGALARAQASLGMVPAKAADAISRTCEDVTLDPDEIGEQAARTGTPVIPLVRALTAAVARRDAQAAAFVHRGATSQDVIDTGLVLQLREAMPRLDADLSRIASALRALARTHADTPMVGRTLLQQGSPVTFGLKAAQWYGAIGRGRRRLHAAGSEALVLQFGGAVGTLSAYGDRGLALADALGRELGLPVPTAPWHTQRDRLLELASAAAILTGSLGKMATDIALLTQTEVGEAFEPAAEGRGGSSAMPHKRNPVGCLVALTAARRTPGLLATLLSGLVQEHERALGGWQAEWPTVPDLFRTTGAALAAMAEVTEGLTVDAAAMRANIERTRGLVFSEALAAALAERVGKAEAHRLVERASRAVTETGRDLAVVAGEMPEIAMRLSQPALKDIFEPGHVLGASRGLIDRLLRDG